MSFEGAPIEPDVWHEYEEGGGFILDETLAFRRSLTRRGYDYWRDLRGDAAGPRKSDLDPASIVPLLPYVVLIDIIRDANGARDYRVRLMGTVAAANHGDGTGMLVSRHLSGKPLYRIRGAIDHVARNGRPVRLASVSGYENREWLHGEGFYAPLLSEAGGLDHVFIVADIWSSAAPVNAAPDEG
ncbi:PAS domain-containing protein [Minwuia thermotolerans]|uniref:PAS domain-containing protein n=1 Tax=Minwuia thermotolerans TaxID=2056226 RepID=A0A2M9G3Z4_9PROT|nr:PAS domain-containing protein [Minwuia thermotolerans]PJK30414.1 hypothetical protein CVT23_07095 [Minwuia thermotolerans]